MSEALVIAVIVVVRSGVPALIVRWPFWGGLLCIVADAFDTVIQDVAGVHPLEAQYHRIDKSFDIYYLAVETVVAVRLFDPVAKWTMLVLFVLRFVAVVLFEITGWRGLLLYVGPNIVENFFVFVSGMRVIDPTYRIASRTHLALVLLFVAAPKIPQEYVMHYREAQTWHFIRDDILLFWR